MTEEFDLNSMLSGSDSGTNTNMSYSIPITKTTEETEMTTEETTNNETDAPVTENAETTETGTVEETPTMEEAPVTPPVAETDGPNEEQGTPVETPVETTAVDTSNMRSLDSFMREYHTKISNASIIDLSTMSGIPTGKHLLFKTSEEENASLIMFDHPDQMWLDNVEPDSIKVEQSGIVIEQGTSRIYAGKSNLTSFQKDENGKIIGMTVISKSRDAAGVKTKTEEVTSTDADLDATKLHVKSISARLYNNIKDMSSKDEIRTKVDEFMDKTKDINHLIKLDKDLKLACQL